MTHEDEQHEDKDFICYMDDGFDYYWNVYAYKMFNGCMDFIIEKTKESESAFSLNNYSFTTQALPSMIKMREIGNDKNKALLNMKSDYEIVQHHCKKVLKGG